MFETLVTSIEQTNADVSMVSWCFDTTTKTNVPTKKEHVEIFNQEEAVRELLINKKITGYVWTKLFKSELLRKIRFRNERIRCHDFVFCSDVFQHIKKAVYQEFHCYHFFKGVILYLINTAICFGLYKQHLTWYIKTPC